MNMRKMKSNLLRTITFTMLVIAASTSGATSSYLSFGSGASDSFVNVDLPVLSANEVVVDIDVPGINVMNKVEGNETFQQIIINGTGSTGKVGAPQLPVISKLVAVPADAQIDIEILSSSYETFNNYNIYPVQEAQPNSTYENSVPFTIDEGIYQTNSLYPSDMVTFEGPVTIRGQSVIILKIVPAQYNPVSQELNLYSNLRVKVSINGSFGVINPKFKSSVFDSMLKRLVVNDQSATADSLSAPSAAYEDGRMMLIVTHPDFIDAANELASWKAKKGINTIVKSTTETGGTASQIQSYIQNAYDNWDVPPTYVLFIGDAEYIPVHYKTTHPYTKGSPQGVIGTDLYYSTVDGDDYFPDINIGRLSVDTSAQALKRVRDIIRYERQPVTNSSYYENAAICAYFQSADGVSAERQFTRTSEDLAIYLSDEEYLGQYSVDRIYYARTNTNPTYWGGYFNGGPAGNAGEMIPEYLQRPEFSWDTSPTDIDYVVNDGRFLVTHRDHGVRNAWSDPEYTVENVNNLTNDNLLPVVWSINCNTGWFDNETDATGNNTSESEINFSEAWERNPNGGAAGVLAATRVSYSGHNDRLFWGFTDAIWPEFIPGYNPTGSNFDQPMFEMGQVMNYGKLYYATTYVDSTYRKTEFEIFHWFGDPTMQIWTAEPEYLIVSHPMELTSPSSIAVTVDRSDALITVSKDDQIIGKALSVAGSAEGISWSESVNAGEGILVVVTKHNYRPYESMAKVVGSSCVEFTGTNPEHKTANRATSVTETTGGWWWMPGTETTTYYAVGSEENLGTSTTEQISLIEESAGIFVSGQCQGIAASSPVIESVHASVEFDQVTITGIVSDVNGDLDVVEVEINNSGDWIVVDDLYNWMLVIVDQVNGDYQIKVRATDDTGLVTELSEGSYSISTGAAPVMQSIEFIVDPPLLTINGIATDENDDIISVELELDNNGTWISASGTNEWFRTLNNLELGSHHVRARAIDSEGYISNIIEADVQMVIQSPPTVDVVNFSINGASITFSGEVSDPDNDVDLIGYSYDDVSGTTMMAWDETVFSRTLTNLASGNHTLWIVAIDAGDRRSESYEINFVIGSNNPPVVKELAVDENANITGLAADYDGNLQTVYVEVNNSGSWVAATGTESFTHVVTGLIAGNHTVKAKAVDASGAESAIYGPVDFAISGEQHPPTVDSFSYEVVGNNIVATGTASDPDGDLSEIHLLIGIGGDLCEGTSTFTCTIENLPTGDYTVALSARDSQGNQSAPTGEQILTIVNDQHAPTVDDCLYILQGDTLTVTGTASDEDGDLEAVIIATGAADGILCDGTESYTCTWSDIAAGTYNVLMVARDSRDVYSTMVCEYTFTIEPVVQEAPVVTLTSSSYHNGILHAEATVTDANGDLDNVNLGFPPAMGVVCSLTGENAICDLDVSAFDAGEHTAKLFAFDANGNESNTIEIPFTVHTPLFESITNTVNNLDVTFTAVVSDQDSDQVTVVLKDTNSTDTWNCTASGSTYSCTITNHTAGEFYFTVVATDAQDHEVSSLPIVVVFTEAQQTCVTATNSDHISAGRANLMYNILVYANGSNDYLGLDSSTTTLSETSPDYWEKVTSCP